MKRKLLIGIASLVSLVLLFVFSFIIYLQFADLNPYKLEISNRLSQYVDRQVVIDGNFNLKIFPLSLSLMDVKIANAPWGSRPDMLKVHQLDLQLGLLALITGELLIDKFVLDDVEALVEHNEQGKNNWRFRDPEIKTKSRTKDSQTFPLDFTSDVDVAVTNVTLLYSQSHNSQKHDFSLKNATIKGLSDLDALEISVSGEIDNHAYRITGQTGVLSQLISGKANFPVELQVNAFATDLLVNGTVKNPLQLEGFQLNVKASAENLSAWQQWLGFNVSRGPVNINADVNGDLNKLSISGLAVQIENTLASGDLTLDLNGKKPVVSTNLNVKNLYVNEFIDETEVNPATKNQAELGDTETSPFQSKLDLKILRLFDASVNLSANKVGYEEWIVDNFKTEIQVKDGQLSAIPFSIVSQLGEAEGNISLVSEQGVHVATLELDARKLALGKFYDMASTYQGIGALRGKLQSKGKTLSDLYAKLQGNLTAQYANKEHKHNTKIVLKRDNPESDNSPFIVGIDGDLKNVPYKITGEIGGPLALIADEPYPATAHLVFANVDTKAKGTIAKLFEAEGFNIDVVAHTNDLGELDRTLDIGLPALKKAQVHTTLQGDYSLLKFHHIKAKSNNLTLTGKVDVSFKGDLPEITGKLDIDQFDLPGMQKEIERTKKRDDSGKKKSTRMEKTKLAEPMSFSGLKDFTLNIKLNTNNNSRIVLPVFDAAKLTADLTVSDSTFTVSPLSIESAAGNIESEIKISAKDKSPTIEARVKGNDIDLEQLASEDKDELFWDAIIKTEIVLRANGKSLQKWLDSVNGDISLNYQQKELPRTYAIRISRKSQSGVSNEPVSIQINSRIGNLTISGSGSISAPRTWLAQKQPTEFDFKSDIKGFETELRGKVDDLVSGKGMDIQVSVNNEQALAASLGPNELVNRVGKVKLISRLKGSPASRITSQLTGNIGNGHVSGTTSVNLQKKPLELEFNFDISDLDISKWAKNDKKAKVDKDTEVKDTDSKLFSSQKLPFEILKDKNIRGSINGNNIQLTRVKAQEIQATVTLQEGTLQFNLDRFTTEDGGLTAVLGINSGAVPPHVSLEMNVPKIDMAEFARNTVAEGLVKGNIGAELSLNASGNSIADMVAGLNGHTRFLVDKGTIDSGLFNVYTGGLRAMVGMLTVKKEKSTKINCGICGLKFENGKGITEVALLDTKNSTLVAEGWVDFNNETFSVKASPVSKGLQLNVSLPVVVYGSFSNPGVSTEATSALVRAAEIATVWFVPTTAIFIGYDQLRSTDQNPCVNMVAPHQEGMGMRMIKGAGKAVQDIGSVFSKSLSTLLGGKSTKESKDE